MKVDKIEINVRKCKQKIHSISGYCWIKTSCADEIFCLCLDLFHFVVLSKFSQRRIECFIELRLPLTSSLLLLK